MTKSRKIGKVLWIALVMEIVISGGIFFHMTHESKERATLAMVEHIENEISERDYCIALTTKQGDGYVIKQMPVPFGDATYYYVEDAELKFVGTLEEWNAWN